MIVASFDLLTLKISPEFPMGDPSAEADASSSSMHSDPKIGVGALIYIVSNGLSRGGSVLLMPLLLAQLSVHAYGQYGLAQGLLAVLPVVGPIPFRR